MNNESSSNASETAGAGNAVRISSGDDEIRVSPREKLDPPTPGGTRTAGPTRPSDLRINGQPVDVFTHWIRICDSAETAISAIFNIQFSSERDTDLAGLEAFFATFGQAVQPKDQISCALSFGYAIAGAAIGISSPSRQFSGKCAKIAGLDPRDKVVSMLREFERENGPHSVLARGSLYLDCSFFDQKRAQDTPSMRDLLAPALANLGQASFALKACLTLMANDQDNLLDAKLDELLGLEDKVSLALRTVYGFADGELCPRHENLAPLLCAYSFGRFSLFLDFLWSLLTRATIGICVMAAIARVKLSKQHPLQIISSPDTSAGNYEYYGDILAQDAKNAAIDIDKRYGKGLLIVHQAFTDYVHLCEDPQRLYDNIKKMLEILMSRVSLPDDPDEAARGIAQKTVGNWPWLDWEIIVYGPVAGNDVHQALTFTPWSVFFKRIEDCEKRKFNIVVTWRNRGEDLGAGISDAGLELLTKWSHMGSHRANVPDPENIYWDRYYYPYNPHSTQTLLRSGIPICQMMIEEITQQPLCYQAKSNTPLVWPYTRSVLIVAGYDQNGTLIKVGHKSTRESMTFTQRTQLHTIMWTV